MWMSIGEAVKAGLGAQSSWSRRIKAGHVASKKDHEGKTLVWIMDESKQMMKLLELVTAQQATIDRLTREEPKLEVVAIKPMKSKPKAKKNKAQSRKIKRAPKRATKTTATSKAANDWINALG